MARFNGATWKPISVNHTSRGQESVRGVVVHIMAGTLSGTDSWFRNPKAQASSHFGTGRTGALWQWVDTTDRAWAQAGGNRTWLSIENEGHGGDALTDAQLRRNAEVLAWAHKTYDVPLQVASGVSGRGLGWHGMGGSAWGGHTQCPGSKIVAQLPEIVKRAKALVDDKPDPAPSGSTYTVKAGDTLSGIGKALGIKWQTLAQLNGLKAPYTIKPGQKLKTKATTPAKPKYQPFPGVAFFKGSPNSPIVTAMGRRLVAEGCSAYKSGPGPKWSDADRESFRKWQRKLGDSGSNADGWPGPRQWDALKIPHV
ncbi:peptidoglycan-binding protein [Streptomyces sp. NPDC051907]|uniref:peptidoglycan-binding protein n=1 Tax=Streptomyces sp. NPDC051907 TaxID=3155284 RepID=UPI0034210630